MRTVLAANGRASKKGSHNSRLWVFTLARHISGTLLNSRELIYRDESAEVKFSRQFRQFSRLLLAVLERIQFAPELFLLWRGRELFVRRRLCMCCGRRGR